MKKKPIVALIYDFDGTLSPGNMQEFGFIQAVGKTPEEFWKMSDGLAAGQDASTHIRRTSHRGPVHAGKKSCSTRNIRIRP